MIFKWTLKEYLRATTPFKLVKNIGLKPVYQYVNYFYLKQTNQFNVRDPYNTYYNIYWSAFTAVSELKVLLFTSFLWTETTCYCKDSDSGLLWEWNSSTVWYFWLSPLIGLKISDVGALPSLSRQSYFDVLRHNGFFQSFRITQFRVLFCGQHELFFGDSSLCGTFAPNCMGCLHG